MSKREFIGSTILSTLFLYNLLFLLWYEQYATFILMAIASALTIKYALYKADN